MKLTLAIICCLVVGVLSAMLAEHSLEQYLLIECERAGFTKLHDSYVACDVLKLNSEGTYYEIGE